MKIILNQDVVHLGEEGDVVVVKDGYARNYLLPTKAAVIYNKANAAMFARKAEAIEQRKIEKRAQSASLKEKLDAAVLNIVVPAGESGKLFGSVTSLTVADYLNKNGFDIERKRIEIPGVTIKTVGNFHCVIHLYEAATAEVKISVKAQESKDNAAPAKKAEKPAKEEAPVEETASEEKSE